MLVAVLEVATVPLQLSDPEPPVAVQLAALVVCQLSDVDSPVTKMLGSALNDTIEAAGGGALLTLTTTELGEPVPAVPEQVNV
jgi:hypothetical protein